MALKLLSIDDSKMVHMVIKKSLAKYDVELTTATNGLEGIEQTQAIKPDIILLDINMPEMDGPEALKKIREIEDFKSTPVIMLTAEDTQKTREGLVELGVNEYLTKPFEESKLVEALKESVELQLK